MTQQAARSTAFSLAQAFTPGAAEGPRETGLVAPPIPGINAWARENSQLPPSRPAFTLIELLIVVVIIGLLASIVLGALAHARAFARVARTRATIAKIDAVVMERYASYRTRRVADRFTREPRFPPATNARLERAPWRVASRQLNVLRDTMRLELPQHRRDMHPTMPPVVFRQDIDLDGDGNPEYRLRYSAALPALTWAYRRNLTNVDNSAECLYLIVTSGSPDARGQFLGSEIGDVDGDGAREFLDGWGRPIRFLRWAPGVTESDVQHQVCHVTGATTAMDWTAAQEAVETDYDPFDPMKVDQETDTAPPDYPPRSWRLIPLIYSAGPDGIYDILADQEQPSDGNPYEFGGNPYYFLDPPITGVHVPLELGRPNDDDNDGRLDHYDNIHNHRIEAD